MRKEARQPTDSDLKQLLAGLVSVEVQVTPTGADVPDALIASYEGDDGSLLAVLCVDLAFAAASGGAIGMLSFEVVEEATKAGKLSGPLLENFREVANIIASLLCGDEYAHVKLVSLEGPLPSVSTPMRAMAETAPRRCGFNVSLDRYGVGRVLFALK